MINNWHKETLVEFARRRRAELSEKSSIPLYYQLSRVLQKFIQSQDLKPGDRFPSEEDVVTCFGVSRPTANKAIQELVDRGWLLRERGRGTFVLKKPLVELQILNDRLSLAAQFKNQGLLQSEIVNREIISASSTLRKMLGLSDNQQVLYFRRLRRIEGSPVMVCDSYLPAERFPGLGQKPFLGGSLYATLEKTYGCTIDSSHRSVEAAEIIEQAVADLLEIPLFSPILLLKGETYVADTIQPIEYMVAYVKEGVAFKNVVHRSVR